MGGSACLFFVFPKVFEIPSYVLFARFQHRRTLELNLLTIKTANISQTFILSLAGSAGVTRRAPIINDEVKSIGSTDQTNFTQWIVVKTVIMIFFDIAKSRFETTLPFFERESISEKHCT